MALKSIPIGEQVKLVRHRAFDVAVSNCASVDLNPPGTMFFVVGPSGAGKTQLSKMLGPMLYGKGPHGNRHPWLRTSLDSPAAGYFSSKATTRDMLAQFRDPFNGMQVFPEDMPPHLVAAVNRALERIGGGRDPSEETMRVVLKSMAKTLECRLLVLDEANMMILIKQGRPLESHLESIRTLALGMGVRTVLFGTFAVLMFMGYSAQINRTSRAIHLDRIRDDTEEGMEEFAGLLDRCEQDLELKEGILLKNAEELYEATYGIPGEMIALLERARMHALANSIDGITQQEIEAAYPLDSYKNRMRQEADLVDRVMKGGRFDSQDMLSLLKERSRLTGRSI